MPIVNALDDPVLPAHGGMSALCSATKMGAIGPKTKPFNFSDRSGGLLDPLLFGLRGKTGRVKPFLLQNTRNGVLDDDCVEKDLTLVPSGLSCAMKEMMARRTVFPASVPNRTASSA